MDVPNVSRKEFQLVRIMSEVRAEVFLLTCTKLDVSEDGFLSLMAENGDTKDDVKVPDGEVGEKIEKLFRTEEKDTSEPPMARQCDIQAYGYRCDRSYRYGRGGCHRG